MQTLLIKLSVLLVKKRPVGWGWDWAGEAEMDEAGALRRPWRLRLLVGRNLGGRNCLLVLQVTPAPDRRAGLGCRQGGRQGRGQTGQMTSPVSGALGASWGSLPSCPIAQGRGPAWPLP